MSLLVVNLLILFSIGLVQDCLNTYYISLVAEKRCLPAACVNFLHNLVGWTIWIWFMYQFQNPEVLNGLQVVVYSAGGALGAYMGIRRPKQRTVPQ